MKGKIMAPRNTDTKVPTQARRTRKPANKNIPVPSDDVMLAEPVTTPMTADEITAAHELADQMASQVEQEEIDSHAVIATVTDIKVGRVVNSSPESRANDFRNYLGKSDESEVSAARILAEIWFNQDWETAGMTLPEYMVTLGVGDDNSDHVLSRKARQEFVGLLKSSTAAMPTTRQYAALTGVSQASANRDLNPAIDSNQSRKADDTPAGDDTPDDKPEQDDKPKFKTLKVALTDAERATLILRAAGIEVGL